MTIAAHLPKGTLLADGYDDCVIGFADRAGETVAVYDKDRCIRKLSMTFRLSCDATESCDVDHDLEAVEFFEFNTQRASDYLGATAPVYVTILGGVEHEQR